MIQLERTAIARLFRDLINADSIIADGEMAFYETVRNKYGLQKEDEVGALGMTLGKAFSVIAKMSNLAKRRLLEDCKDMTVSDGFCDRTEALLMMALRYCVGVETGDNADVISVPKQLLTIEESTVVYVESVWDEAANQEIANDHRNILHELRLVGFEFIYIPAVVDHLKNTPQKLLRQVLEYISPQRDAVAIDHLIQKLTQITTAEFTKDVLCNKFGMESLRTGCSSLLVKIGEDYVGGEMFSNYLRIDVERNVKELACDFVDMYSSMQWNASTGCVSPLVKEGQFLYYGFYKLLLDIYVVRTKIPSRIVVDFTRWDIRLPEIHSSLKGLHRKEKAFYVLLLIESRLGSVSFAQPKTKGEIEAYRQNMRQLQEKYCYIYTMMGGEREKVPNIENPAIRLPIIASIKKCINRLSSELYQVQDYLINKDAMGRLFIPLTADMAYFRDFKDVDEQPLKDFLYPN